MLRPVPEAPGALPLLGHLPALVADLPGVLRRAQRACGPVFALDLGPRGRLVVLAGESALALLRDPALRVGDVGDPSGLIVGRSLLAQDGAHHRRLRQLVQPAFAPAALARAESLLAGRIEERVRSWMARRAIDVARETRRLSLDVLFTLLGVPRHELDAWRSRYDELALGVLPIPLTFPGSPWWRARRAARWIDAGLRARIAAARRGESPDDLVAALVHARDERGAPLGDDELLDNLRLLVFAGHETSATTLAWTALYLGHHPRTWDALVDAARGAGERSYADAVFREALRLHPTLPIVMRELAAPVAFEGFELAAGASVGVAVAAISRAAARYPEPDAFRPERWLLPRGCPHAAERSAIRRHTAEQAPFGGGPHVCPGQGLARLEGALFAAIFARILAGAGLRPACKSLPRGITFPVERLLGRIELAFVPAARRRPIERPQAIGEVAP